MGPVVVGGVDDAQTLARTSGFGIAPSQHKTSAERGLRATGVTVYLENGGRLEHVQQMAGMSRPGPPSFMTGPKTRSQSAKSSGFNFNCWLVEMR
jgi:hypothetical protein